MDTREAKIVIALSHVVMELSNLGLPVDDEIIVFRSAARIAEQRKKFLAAPFDTTGIVQRTVAEEIAMCGKVPERNA
jgi:hypothetical protein